MEPMVGMRNIGQDKIREIVIPVPPLAEQQEHMHRFANSRDGRDHRIAIIGNHNGC